MYVSLINNLLHTRAINMSAYTNLMNAIHAVEAIKALAPELRDPLQSQLAVSNAIAACSAARQERQQGCDEQQAAVWNTTFNNLALMISNAL